MVEKKVVEKIEKFVKALRREKINIAKVILYGSRASGESHEYSDIDVAVVSPDFGKDRFEEGAQLFKIACKIDSLIEPVPISLESYEKDTWIPLIYEIRENGVELETMASV
ncbi:MAG: nucleotidyltransferase domain-containing protein [Nitrospinae bacterium]|nr:nucleotidyltransferase domain-containing protein [Nitrospinota bacterium]